MAISWTKYAKFSPETIASRFVDAFVDERIYQLLVKSFRQFHTGLNRVVLYL